MASTSSSSSSSVPVIDEALYSRQLYVIDHASMLKIMETNVLLVGLGGLGVEIGALPFLASPSLPLLPLARDSHTPHTSQTAAKCIILAGIKSVTLFDKEPATAEDLGSQVRPPNQSKAKRDGDDDVMT